MRRGRGKLNPARDTGLGTKLALLDGYSERSATYPVPTA